MLDLASFKDTLKNSGVNEKLKAIAEESKAEIEKVLALDMAGMSPTALFAVAEEAQAKVSAATDGLIAQADLAAPKLTLLQDKMGELLAGVPSMPTLSISSLGLPSIPGAPSIPGVDALLASAPPISLGSAPSLGGLAAMPGRMTNLITDAPDIPLPGVPALPSFPGIPKLPDVDPGKLLGDMKDVPALDDAGVQLKDALGNLLTKVQSIKLGSPPVVPVFDEEEDEIPVPFVLAKPMETVKNAILSDTGIGVALGRSLINKFDGIPVATEVVFDESTGENIIFEMQKALDGGLAAVPSGFPDLPTFEAEYKAGRDAAAGHMQKMAGALKQVLGENTTSVQNTFQLLSKVTATLPVATMKEGLPRIFTKDAVTGVAISPENLLGSLKPTLAAFKAAKPGIDKEMAKVDKSLTSFFNQMGAPLPPGSEPPSFDEETKDQ
jgi:hypothetical protein